MALISFLTDYVLNSEKFDQQSTSVFGQYGEFGIFFHLQKNII